EAPETLAEVPASGREIRLWYRTGGGSAGNVAAGTLTTLKDSIPGIEVTNPRPATGGRAVESLENALLRGPLNFHSLERAVTARDFEILASRSSGAVARARAFTTAALWKHATPGTVEVLLVPDVPPEVRTNDLVTSAILQEYYTETARSQIQRALDERRPLGTLCIVDWVRCKTVRVSARIVARREEDAAAIRQRVVRRLNQTISPLPSELRPTGWDFGEALRAFHVYNIVRPEPGVRYVDQVRLSVEDVPEKDIASLAADRFQPHTWYAASGS